MSREEFLRGLRKALSGELPPGALQSNMNYYDEYIRTEIGKGRREEDVLEELGDPRLIARTIIDTTPGAGEFGGAEGDAGGYGGAYEDGNGSRYGNGGYEDGSDGYSGEPGGYDDSFDQRRYRQKGSVHYYDLNKWYWKLLGIVAVILVVTVVIGIISGIMSLLVPLMPVIAMVMIIMWIVRSFKQ